MTDSWSSRVAVATPLRSAGRLKGSRVEATSWFQHRVRAVSWPQPTELRGQDAHSRRRRARSPSRRRDRDRAGSPSRPPCARRARSGEGHRWRKSETWRTHQAVQLGRKPAHGSVSLQQLDPLRLEERPAEPGRGDDREDDDDPSHLPPLEVRRALDARAGTRLRIRIDTSSAVPTLLRAVDRAATSTCSKARAGRRSAEGRLGVPRAEPSPRRGDCDSRHVAPWPWRRENGGPNGPSLTDRHSKVKMLPSITRGASLWPAFGWPLAQDETTEVVASGGKKTAWRGPASLPARPRCRRASGDQPLPQLPPQHLAVRVGGQRFGRTRSASAS